MGTKPNRGEDDLTTAAAVLATATIDPDRVTAQAPPVSTARAASWLHCDQEPG